MTRVLWAAGLGLLAAGSALAAPRPSIASLKNAWNKTTTTFATGDLVRVTGSGLHVCDTAPEGSDEPASFRCQHDELTLRVAGKPVKPTGWSPTSVTFNVPQDLKPGRYRIELTLRRRGSVSTHFEVVSKRKKGPDDGGKTGEDKLALRAERLARRSIAITRFEFVRRPANEQRPADMIVEVAGQALGVPDGLEVALILRHGKSELLHGSAQIKGEAFQTTFGPYTKRLPYGPYTLDLLFELGKQSKRKAGRWKKTLNPAARGVYGRLLRVKHTTLGTPAQRAKQHKRLAQSSDALLKALDTQLAAFQEAYADAGRSLFKLPGQAGFDRVAWEAWLAEQGLEPASPRFATKAGHFKYREFERWIETEWLPGLEPAIKGFRDFNAATLVPSDPQAVRVGEELVGLVLEGLRRGVRSLYEHSKLTLRPSVLAALPETRRQPGKLNQRTYDSLRSQLIRLRKSR